MAGKGRGKSELMDINGCGFDGEGSGSGEGGTEGGERGRETDGKDEKAEKITHEANRWQMKGWRVLG